MLANPAKPPTEELVDRVLSRRLDILLLLTVQAADEAEIIKLGAGKHTGSLPENELNVIAASEGKEGAVTYALPADGEAKARTIAGDKFPVLFERKVTYAPIEGIEHVAPTHLKPARARDLVALITVQAKATSGRKAYILYPKAGK